MGYPSVVQRKSYLYMIAKYIEDIGTKKTISAIQYSGNQWFDQI